MLLQTNSLKKLTRKRVVHIETEKLDFIETQIAIHEDSK
jgi:hypothetical protein